MNKLKNAILVFVGVSVLSVAFYGMCIGLLSICDGGLGR